LYLTCQSSPARSSQNSQTPPASSAAAAGSRRSVPGSAKTAGDDHAPWLRTWKKTRHLPSAVGRRDAEVLAVLAGREGLDGEAVGPGRQAVADVPGDQRADGGGDQVVQQVQVPVQDRHALLDVDAHVALLPVGEQQLQR